MLELSLVLRYELLYTDVLGNGVKAPLILNFGIRHVSRQSHAVATLPPGIGHLVSLIRLKLSHP